MGRSIANKDNANKGDDRRGGESKNGRSRWRWQRLWPWLIVLAVYGVIFWFSSQPGTVSDSQTERVQSLVGMQSDWAAILVRKMAHVVLFCTLGASACFAWFWTNRNAYRLRRALLYAAVLCLALAGLDELHQLFISERSAELADVALDTASAALGAWGMTGCIWLQRQWKRRSLRNPF